MSNNEETNQVQHTEEEQEIENVQKFEEEEQEFIDEQIFEEEEQEFIDNGQSDEGFSLSYSSNDDQVSLDSLNSNIRVCSTVFVGFQYIRNTNNRITIKIPNSILPLSINSINGFLNSPFLVECIIDFNQIDRWKNKPDHLLLANDFYGKTFPGSILLKNRIYKFFSKDFKPQEKYRCQCYALAPQDVKTPKNSEELIKQLEEKGFSEKLARKALEFCSFDVKKSIEYLFFGTTLSNELPFKFILSENPLFYLTLEMCEAFFDMGDCCCVCGAPLGIYHIKPSCCDEPICQYSFLTLGVGSNIIAEIKRDPLASDLIISLAAAACFAPKHPPVFEPSPESDNLKFDPKFFEVLPSMKKISETCNNDIELRAFLGDQNFEILRFFILANKAQFMTIPKSLKVNVKVNGTQFLVTSVSPKSELIFRQKREEKGVVWLWHGSLTDRWYRILHTGLKDFGQTEFTTHGPPYFGKGIYMSESFHYSYWYCTSAPNKYKNSALPKDLLIISLVENANTPGLTKPVTNHEYTQKDDQACITRVLFVMDPSDQSNQSLDTNTINMPPVVPDFQSVLLSSIKKF